LATAWRVSHASLPVSSSVPDQTFYVGLAASAIMTVRRDIT
jgi:hypothetical protein